MKTIGAVMLTLTCFAVGPAFMLVIGQHLGWAGLVSVLSGGAALIVWTEAHKSRRR
jgi:hypothetical protein